MGSAKEKDMKNIKMTLALAALAMIPAAGMAQSDVPSISEIVVTKSTDIASTSLMAKKPNAEMDIVLADGTQLKGIAAFVDRGLFKPARAGASGTGKTLSAGVMARGDGKKVVIHFVKTTSDRSAAFYKAAKGQQRLKSMTLTVASGNKPEDYFKVTMKDVLVSSWSTSAAGDTAPAESFSLNFGAIKFEYKPQK